MCILFIFSREEKRAINQDELYNFHTGNTTSYTKMTKIKIHFLILGSTKFVFILTFLFIYLFIYFGKGKEKQGEKIIKFSQTIHTLQYEANKICLYLENRK